MITVSVVGREELVAKLDAIPEAVRKGLRSAILEQLIQLQGYVKEQKLTGQVLKVQTGTLRRSINVSSLEETGSKISGAVGTNTQYGKLHEYGLPVRAHTRLITQVFGRQLKFPEYVNVKAFTMPERSFLRSALEDRAEDIQIALQLAVQEAVVATMKGSRA